MAVTWRKLIIEDNAYWIDLTDGGATTLHKHDHGGQDGLSDDDHAQYALLAGRATGQVLYGGTASGDDLTLESTSNATKGDVLLQPNGGNVGIGTTSPGYALDIAAASTRLVGTGNTFTYIDTYTDTASAGAYVFARRARGTIDSASAVQSGDTLGGFAITGHNSGSMLTTGQAIIIGQASENWSASPAYRGTRLLFYNTTNNASSVSLKMTLENTGSLGLGASPSISDGVGLHIAGKILRLATSKSPTSGGTGNVGEICWDTSYLYVCTATNTWKRVALTGGY